MGVWVHGACPHSTLVHACAPIRGMRGLKLLTHPFLSLFFLIPMHYHLVTKHLFLGRAFSILELPAGSLGMGETHVVD